uniref:Uncharacterized protein n=1 Tax=Avena sativa TaxID=4498 RepID=A0ACD5UB93_AVESA
MYRQFVNLIMHDQRSTLYSMRRLGIIPHLFHESPASDAQVAAANKKGCLSRISSCNHLPRPDINFALQPKMADVTPMHFFSLLRGQGDGCVMFTAPFGLTTVYDVAMQSVIAMPQANFSKPSDSIALSMTPRGDHYQLYVMGRAGVNGSFEVFNYCRAGAPTVGGERWWSWDPLPSPPQVEPYLHGSRMCPSAAAVLDETTICVSSIDGGAYTFDTVKCLWRQAGSWVLPFQGAAEYVPELGLWFGLEATCGGSPHHRLCAFDLSLSWPPVVQHAWDYLDDGLPDHWVPLKRHLVNLGSGRFCIATSFRAEVKHAVIAYGFSSDEEQVEIDEYTEATLLTGVDVVRCGSGALEMIKHKSRLYDIEGMNIRCVL